MTRWRVVAAWGIILFTLGLLIFGTVLLAGRFSKPRTLVTIGSAVIKADLARTTAEQARGLGGVTGLSPTDGMLFIFAHDGTQPMWMKDMLINLDIIWINNGKKVVHIEHDLTPQTYPQIYYSADSARYVLEVPAGTATNAGIKIGTTASFDLT